MNSIDWLRLSKLIRLPEKSTGLARFCAGGPARHGPQGCGQQKLGAGQFGRSMGGMATTVEMINLCVGGGGGGGPTKTVALDHELRKPWGLAIALPAAARSGFPKPYCNRTVRLAVGNDETAPA